MAIEEKDSRMEMKTYWEHHRDISDSTIETMMLDSHAKTLHEIERPEILSKLPANLEKMDVVELASGIGRYTSLLAPKCKTITSVEFINEFHEQNKKKNGTLYSNTKFICEDVTNLQLPSESYDLIFSNWLFMYLNDEEVHSFVKKALKWLRPNGYLFFRESCWKKSGDLQRDTNPTKYRHPRFYIGAFSGPTVWIPSNKPVTIDEEDINKSNIPYQFELLSSSSVSAYRKVKQNHGQVCFLYQKKKIDNYIQINDKENKSFQEFLDTQQYSTTSITRYEKIFGNGYVSTGGQETTTEFINLLNLKENQHVLDVGCGIGGGDFYMANKYNVTVHGIDLSSNMIHFAMEKAMKLNNKINALVEFEICDATKKEFNDATFDVIYSRDTILHIEDKLSLFRKFYKWLKPGGYILISDYCCIENYNINATPYFKEYVKNRGYFLVSPKEYGILLTEAGFINVNAQDRTEQFIQILTKELETTKKNKDEFIKETSEKDYLDIIHGWESKIIRCNDGDQKWGLFFAMKPMN